MCCERAAVTCKKLAGYISSANLSQDMAGHQTSSQDEQHKGPPYTLIGVEHETVGHKRNKATAAASGRESRTSGHALEHADLAVLELIDWTS